MPLAYGLFAHPKRGRFGAVPPTDEELMRAFLDGAPFVFTGPDRWNALGLGSTALFARPLVYNTKRSGTFELGGRRFLLRRVAFPDTPPEWFVVDLLEHADQAGASRADLASALGRALARRAFNRGRLRAMAREYGTLATLALVESALAAGPREIRPRRPRLRRPAPDRRQGEERSPPGSSRRTTGSRTRSWALQASGLDVWFKGGTSLSKGFGLIERFSEDLDLKLEPGRITGIPPVTDWKREGTQVVSARKAHLQALAAAVSVPGMTVRLDRDLVDEHWRSVNIQVAYPAKHLGSLSGVLKPFVLLEVGSARVTPSVPCDMAAFIHEELVEQGQLSTYDDNRPKQVRCVHPLVTLLEKIDALHRRFPREDASATFVRHFEDAARVIQASATLPPMPAYVGVRALADEMMTQRQLASLPSSSDIAFTPTAGERLDAIRAAHAAIAPMFWGPRVTLDDACEAIRSWIAETFERKRLAKNSFGLAWLPRVMTRSSPSSRRPSRTSSGSKRSVPRRTPESPRFETSSRRTMRLLGPGRPSRRRGPPPARRPRR